MTNSGKRRRAEKRARAQLAALLSVQGESDGLITSKWGEGRTAIRPKISQREIKDEIKDLEQRLFIKN